MLLMLELGEGKEGEGVGLMQFFIWHLGETSTILSAIWRMFLKSCIVSLGSDSQMRMVQVTLQVMHRARAVRDLLRLD